LSWIKEFLKNLYNEGAIGNTKFDKLEQLILQN